MLAGISPRLVAQLWYTPCSKRPKSLRTGDLQGNSTRIKRADSESPQEASEIALLTRMQLDRIAKRCFVLITLLSIIVGNSCSPSDKHSGDLQRETPKFAIPSVFFGLHIQRAATTTPWPPVPFATWRLWDAYVAWPDLEPQQGIWRFETLDKYLALAEEHKVEVLLPLGLSPAWASARPAEPSGYQPGFAAEPKEIQHWRDYVRAVATRYKGRIRFYEIWNEPNLKDFYTGSVDQMVTLVRESSKILKEVDPSITVVSPSATGAFGTPWLEEFLGVGGGQYVDVIGYHFYVTPEPPEAMVSQVLRVREIMAKYGVASKPLWNTESGWLIENHKTEVKPKPGGFSKVLSDEEASSYVARSYILNWAAGASRFYWYAWDDFVMGLTEADGTAIKPPAMAFAEVAKWLIGARMTSCTSDSANTWICQLSRESGYAAWIVWNPDRNLIFELPSSWGVRQKRDLSGLASDLSDSAKIDIGALPVLLEKPAQ